MSDEFVIKTSRSPSVEGLASRLEALGLRRLAFSPTEFSLGAVDTAASVIANARWGALIEVRVERNQIWVMVNGYSPRRVMSAIADELCMQGIEADTTEP